jgi:hypothetical protein
MLLLSILGCFVILNCRLVASQDDSLLPNDECVDAILLLVDGAPVPSSTIGATVSEDSSISIAQCGGETIDTGTPGVWFVVEGTGTKLKASTCHEQSDSSGSTSPFAHRITLYSGTDCANRFCFDTSIEEDTGCPFPHSTSVEWDTDLGDMYFMFVHDQVSGEQNSDFFISVTDASEPPNNNICENATVLEEQITTGDDQVVINTGTTVGSTEKDIQLSCTGDRASTGPTVGVWYKIPASSSDDSAKNETIILFMCSRPFELEFAVFTGDPCGKGNEILCQETQPSKTTLYDIQCVSKDEILVSISWNANSGLEYHVLVYGPDYSFFGLTFLRTDGGNYTNEPNIPESSSRKEKLSVTWFVLLSALLRLGAIS